MEPPPSESSAPPTLDGEAQRASRRSVAIAALVTASLAFVPSSFVGFYSDDMPHRLLLEGALPVYTGGWLGLYDFTPPHAPTATLVEHAMLPWFTDADLSLRFLRPLASLTLALDHALFGRDAWLAHLHGGLWMLVLALAAAAIYRRWLPARAAVLASVLFALSPVHAIPLSWLASRHSLVAAAFGALALWAWPRRTRERAGAWRLALASTCLGASLLASETGLVAVVLITSMELGGGSSRRLARAALPLGMGLAHLVAYVALGYGVRGSQFYISPFDSPLAYARAAALGVPALAAELLLGVPSIVAGMGASVLLAFAGLGALASAGAVLWLRALGDAVTARERRTLGWACAGALLALTSLVGAPVSGRVLPLPALATAALAAVLLERTWQLARGRRPAPGELAAATRGRWGWRSALAVGALFQLGLGPLLRIALPLQLAQAASTQEKIAREADVGRCAQGGSLYLVNGSDPTLAMYAAPALRFHTPEKAGAERLRTLSMAPGAQRLTRSAPSVLLLEVLGQERQSTPFERLFRGASAPLEPGWRAHLPDLDVHVEATQGGLFTRVRFERAGPFDASTCLLVWRNGRLESEPLPEVGTSVLVEHQPGPMGL